MLEAGVSNATIKSHPVRGAWIEILVYTGIATTHKVASRKGCVD